MFGRTNAPSFLMKTWIRRFAVQIITAEKILINFLIYFTLCYIKSYIMPILCYLSGITNQCLGNKEYQWRAVLHLLKKAAILSQGDGLSTSSLRCGSLIVWSGSQLDLQIFYLTTILKCQCLCVKNVKKEYINEIIEKWPTFGKKNIFI